MNRHWITIFAALAGALAASKGIAQPHVHVADADRGMVVSETAIASAVGQRMLRRGGNAVDAAVATAFALAVTWPEAGNIGGGGFMMIRPPNGEPVCIDYRETAPGAAQENTYQRTDGYFTRKVVGVPGTVRGLALAHRRYGKLPWRELVLPAVTLARDGFSVDRFLAASMNQILTLVGDDAEFAELRRVYGKPAGGPWKVGDVLVLPDLARTLASIADQGPDAFYQGRLAKLLIDEMRRGQGLISQADLDTYQAKVRAPIVGTFRGYEILGAPPPSSGGTCLVETLNIIEALQVDETDRFSAKTIHLIAEASRRAFLDRARYLGDPDFVDIPTQLTTKSYARKLAASVEREQATASQALAPEIKLADESPDTTHFSIVDGQGMAVSNTYTLEASWGSRIVVRGAGYLLNNEMGDFNWFPGVTTRAGRIGTAANVVAPHKRMLSSQCPVIVTKDGHVALVTGSPGGRTIINTVCNVVLNVIHFGMDAAAAVKAPRMHHQWFPDRIELEARDRGPHAEVVKALQAMGHEVVNRSMQGSAHTIWYDPQRKKYIGIADYRRGGRPVGYASDTCAVWSFDERQGTLLTKTHSDGPLTSIWSHDLAGASVDGAGHYQIQQVPPAGPRETYLDLQARGLTAASVRLKLSKLTFAGKQPNEQLRIALSDQSDRSQTIAGLVIERSDDNQLVLRGVTPQANAGEAPLVLAPNGSLQGPVTFRLDVNTQRNRYQIHVRRGSTTKWKSVMGGKIAPEQTIGYVRFGTRNDLREPDELIDVDRIEIRCRPR